MRIVGGPAPPLGAQGRSGLRAQWGPLDRSRRGRGHPGPAGDAPAGGGNGSGGPGAGRDAEVGAAAAPAGHPGAAGLPRPAGPGRVYHWTGVLCCSFFGVLRGGAGGSALPPLCELPGYTVSYYPRSSLGLKSGPPASGQSISDAGAAFPETVFPEMVLRVSRLAQGI